VDPACLAAEAAAAREAARAAAEAAAAREAERLAAEVARRRSFGAAATRAARRATCCWPAGRLCCALATARSSAPKAVTQQKKACRRRTRPSRGASPRRPARRGLARRGGRLGRRDHLPGEWR
jgi:hypothetical protein